MFKLEARRPRRAKVDREGTVALKPVVAFLLLLTTVAFSQDLRPPDHPVAGTSIKLETTGSGDATFYLVGPATALKRTVKLGEPIEWKPEVAGTYTAILKGVTRTFYVAPGPPSTLVFLARPSRVAVEQKNAVSGVAFVFDANKNLSFAPGDVKFDLKVGEAAASSRSVPAHNGIAWTRFDSARREGAAQFVASLGSTSVRRVVQLTAAEPCNLRFHTSPAKKGVLVETDPVRDCAGNPVPDGTIVTFIENDGRTRSTIDARIKRGIARAELPASPNATISAASGVVLGNEVRLGGGR
jgi:hypothetical protein